MRDKEKKGVNMWAKIKELVIMFGGEIGYNFFLIIYISPKKSD